MQTIKRPLEVLVVGCTGAIGENVVALLEKDSMPINITLSASEKSIDKKISFRGKEIEIQAMKPELLEGKDVVFFATGVDVSLAYKDIAKEKVPCIIDSSSAFRQDEKVPLVVPEINGDLLQNHRGWMASPNCTTTFLVLTLFPILKHRKVERVITSTYQAVSGAGNEGIQELLDQTKAYLEGRPLENKLMKYPIAMNIIPQIDVLDEGRFYKEEMKVILESRRILNLPQLQVTATAMRVPVVRAHTLSVTVDLDKDASIAELQSWLREAEGVVLKDDTENYEYPMPLNTSFQNEIFVGRIRQDLDRKNTFHYVIVGDQLLKGGALNAYQMMQTWLKWNGGNLA